MTCWLLSGLGGMKRCTALHRRAAATQRPRPRPASPPNRARPILYFESVSSFLSKMADDDATFEQVLRMYGSKTPKSQKMLAFVDSLILFLVPLLAYCGFLFQVDGRDPLVLGTLLTSALIVIPLLWVSHIRYARAKLVQLQRTAAAPQLDEKRLVQVAMLRALASNNIWYLGLVALCCGHIFNGRFFDALNFGISSLLGASFLLVNASAAMQVAREKRA